MAKDFLEEIVAERTRRNPAFPAMVQAEKKTRKKAAKLARRTGKAVMTETE